MAKNVVVVQAGLSGVPSSRAARQVYATTVMTSTAPICRAYHCNACSTRLLPVPASPVMTMRSGSTVSPPFSRRNTSARIANAIAWLRLSVHNRLVWAMEGVIASFT